MKDLLDLLDLRHPLVVAPMAGGPTTPELVAACSNAGALGSLGAAYLSPHQIQTSVASIRRASDRSFAVNLFVPTRDAEISTPAQKTAAFAATAAYRSELGLPEPELTAPFEENFDEQFEAALAARPRSISFVFGLLDERYLKAAKAQDILLIGTATSPNEARALADSGVDAITLQGFEAGGHRGIFGVRDEDPEISTLELLRACRAQVNLPLIAAGGIMSAEQIRAALSAGAQAVQMGTAFLACAEAGTSAPYRAAHLQSSNRRTRTTRVFSGRLARGIENRFMREMEARGETVLLPWPAQNAFTRDLRMASVKCGSSDFLSLWCGSGEGVIGTGSAADLIARLFAAAN